MSTADTPPLRRVTLSVDADDYERFDRIAKRTGVSASWLVRKAMREFLERHADDGSFEVRFDVKKDIGE
ncbi:ribbon-helix-helix domain-containing protein [Oleisolibacter albus]|uniref:ribbon-helix-helix domain-containing protein n=1 Tax=Oleisolibacter albus TaxID=2171757 RepID=UPI000DF3BE57|nr:ribbon-helix-helix domain-containing protein [Oleisolibacter albus]